MALKLHYPEGATPLDADEARDLIPGHISTQAELNEWEQQNILAAERWAFGARQADILTPDYLRKLHKRMFDRTWKWAGKYRTTEKNIGIDPAHIAPEVKNLCEDVKAQVADGSWPLDNIAARLHHRLTQIHPFPNGNGRFARSFADLVLVRNGAERFSWGAGDLHTGKKTRARYLDALRAADARDDAPLLAFVRSTER